MRRLADEAEHVPLDPEGAEHHAGRLVHRFEDRTLFDVQLEVGACVDGFQMPMRVAHPIEIDAVLAQRVDETRPLTIDEVAHLVDSQTRGRRR